MFNNKKGFGLGIFAGAMTAIIVFIMAVQFITPIKDQIIDARAVDALDCTNSSISTGNKATCIVVDWTLPYFIALIIATGAGLITGFGVKRITSS